MRRKWYGKRFLAMAMAITLAASSMTANAAELDAAVIDSQAASESMETIETEQETDQQMSEDAQEKDTEVSAGLQDEENLQKPADSSEEDIQDSVDSSKEKNSESIDSKEAVHALEEGAGRTKVNFNKDWKFVRQDVKGAEAVAFDDSSWVDVALPHNFSIPYDMSSKFYVGYGWYRKNFNIPENWSGKKIELEFEGVFQVAEIYVNGQAVGTHEGGYSGFVYDITDKLHTGDNEIAVRVNNIWQQDLAPRAGDHQFTGGIYRDVYLNVTEDVHVAWYGTYVTTPALTNPAFDQSAKNIDFTQFPSDAEIQANVDAKRSDVRVQTEVVNASAQPRQVQVKQTVKDDQGKSVAEFASAQASVPAGQTVTIDAKSDMIQNIKLWSPDTPNLYTVETQIISDGKLVDTYESNFGFRWVQWKNDAFYLNGVKTYLNGANAHQDHGGWSDAVTNEGFQRDVSMIKECGMNFIRGSHYPHDPAYAEACDEEGVMFWSECNYWGMGGCAGKNDDPVYNASDWLKDAYPQREEDQAAFEQSCMDSLEAMIRVNRNHPSIINWSMGNEVFFTNGGMEQKAGTYYEKARELVNKMRNRAHELDPTRKAGMGGVQRGGYDKIEVCDIAGYNGDGAKSDYVNHTMPNLVAEYSSGSDKQKDRPGDYKSSYGYLATKAYAQKTCNENLEDGTYADKPGNAGMSRWCAFHHGTVGSLSLAKTGMIDYYRLPLNLWYWYREHDAKTAPVSSKSGTAAKISLVSRISQTYGEAERGTSETTITNDGSKDAQILVTLQDANGNWVNDTREVTLKVKEGPGIFPGGKTFTFVPKESIVDGKAAIEFRSYYTGTTTIEATAEGLPASQIQITTVDADGAEDKVTQEPDNFYNASAWGAQTSKIDEPMAYGTNKALARPTSSSSAEDSNPAGYGADGSLSTSWIAKETGSGQSFSVHLEWGQYLYKIKLGFHKTPYPFDLQVKDMGDEDWTTVASYTKETISQRPLEERLDGIPANVVQVVFTDVPEGEKAFLSELEVYGNESSQAPQYTDEGLYLSDVLEKCTVTTGEGTVGKDKSCGGKAIRVGDVTYEKGIGLHADSQLTYELNGKYSRIAGVAGIDREVSGGDAIFQIYADETLIYNKNLSGSQADAFHLSISGAKTLRLVTDQNGSKSNDHTDWADIRLFGAVRDISKEGTGLKVENVSLLPQLRAGEEFRTMMTVRNTGGSEKSLLAGISQYDGNGKLVDYTMGKINVPKEGSRDADVRTMLPSKIEGYTGRISLLDRNAMVASAQNVFVGADLEKLSAEGRVSWKTKVDGEDSILAKTGSWSLWKADSAYQGTETCGNNTNDTITWKFTGDYVRLAAKVDGSQKGCTVSVDGGAPVAVSTTSADTKYNGYDVVWTSEKLAQKGEHTIVVTASGKFGMDYLEAGVAEEESASQVTPVYQPLLDEIAKVLQMAENSLLEGYTEESVKKLADAFEAAYSIYAAKDTSKDEAYYKQQAAALGGAVTALETVQVDKSALEKAVAQWKDILNGNRVYTKESAQKFEAAVKDAQKLLESENPTQTAINQAYKNLSDAYASLEDGVQKAELQKAIADAKAVLNDAAAAKGYTQESIAKAKDALQSAEAIAAKEYTDVAKGQQEVNGAIQELITAMNSLTKSSAAKAANLEKLQKAVKEAEKIPQNELTSKSAKALKQALSKAKALIQGKPAASRQAEVDKVAKALDQARKDVVSALPKKNTKVTVGSYVYKVTSSTFSSKTLTLLKPKKSNQKKASIPSAVKVKVNGKGIAYKVTAVSAKAFSKNTKLTSVTIGKNVKTVGSKAFYGCKNLKKIVISSKELKSIGKDAFKGIQKNARIEIPKAKKKAYIKILKKKGQGSKVKIVAK